MKIITTFVLLMFSSMSLAITPDPDEWAIEYSNGVRVFINQEKGSGISVPDAALLAEGEVPKVRAAPVPRVSEETVLSQVSDIVKDYEQYGLEAPGILQVVSEAFDRSSDPTADPNETVITQNFGGIDFEALTIRHFDDGGYIVEGVLLDPSAPELQSENWLSEEEARDLALGVLKQFGPVEHLATERVRIDINLTDGNPIQIIPNYRASTADGSAVVNLYTGEVHSREESILLESKTGGVWGQSKNSSGFLL